MDDDSVWLCTQAMVSADDRSDDGKENLKDFGKLVLNDMFDNECYVLKEGDNTIGRHPLNHIYIEHSSVSMHHAVIQCDSDGVVLLDKGSLNKTRLNKKNLKKGVAYFLDENAILMFGEVQVNYYVNREPSKTTHEIKSNTSNDTSIQTNTEKCETSIQTLSNTIITPSISFDENLPDEVTDCNVSTAIGHSSIGKMEIVVPKAENSNNAHHIVASKLNLSSFNDEFLLEAISQVELIENNLNSSKIVQSISREETPSPVMDLTETMKKGSDLQQFSNKVTHEITREDTPSPTFHFGSPLSHQFSITNNKPINMFQSPDKTITKDVREDTPSPLMNLEHFDNSNILSTLDVNNHDILLDNEYISKLDEFNETQILDSSTQKLPTTGILNTSKITKPPKHYWNTQPEIKELNVADESTQVPLVINKDDSFYCQPRNDSSNLSTKGDESNLLEVQTFENLCTSEPNNCQLNEVKAQTTDLGDTQFESTINAVSTLDIKNLYSNSPKNEFKIGMAQHIELVNLNSLNCPAKISPTSKPCNSSISMSQLTKQKQNITENNFNTSKADDDDLFFYTAQKVESSINNSNINSKNILIEEKTQQSPQQNDEDFFNCATQKLSIPKKKITSTKPSTINELETQTFSQFQQISKINKINSSSSDNLTKLQEMDNEDFFNCPTQKLSIPKKNITSTKPSTINELETQTFSQFQQISKINKINSSSPDNLTKLQEMDDEDFFNCPTQKLSIPKKNITTTKPSTINELETQTLSQFQQISKINKINSSSPDNLTKLQEMDDEDFFNCPTQKLSIPKKNITSTKPSTINELETQTFSQFQQISKINKINSSSPDNLTKLQEMDDEDFFNCPTQKLSIPKKNITSTKPSTINELETQTFSQFQQISKINKINSSSPDNLTKLQEMDDEDFFNCPTQKLSIPKKNITTTKLSTINELETQTFSQFQPISKINKINSSSPDNLTKLQEMDDEDFFNCPTQKLSIPKKNITTTKPSTINELETQTFSQFQQISKINKINSSSPDNLTKLQEMDDEDFFNCPTQKLSIPKKKITSTKPSTINELETQTFSQFQQISKINKINSSSPDNLTKLQEMDDEDFFNCPTQKLSIPKKKITSTKPSTINELETQTFSQFQQISKPNKINSSSPDNLTKLQEMDDEDFFNCPTQKLSIPKKKITSTKPSTINELETQTFSQFQQISKINKINSSSPDNLTKLQEMDDEDFFNCPTQKLSIPKKKITSTKPSTINELETQTFSQFQQISKPNKINSSSPDNLTKLQEMDDEDFFNCPTQKLSIPKKNITTTKPSTINELETQTLSQFQQISKINKINSSSPDNLTKLQEMDDEDFFNCPTQKLSIPKKNITTNLSTINEVETQTFSECQHITKSNKTNFSIHKDLIQLPEIDDNSLNGVHQNILVTTKQKLTKLSTAIKKDDLKKCPEPNKTNTMVSNDICTSNLLENLTQILEVQDNDYFECPTSSSAKTESFIYSEKKKLSDQDNNEIKIMNSTVQSIVSVTSNETKKLIMDQNLDTTTNQKQLMQIDNINKNSFQKSSFVSNSKNNFDVQSPKMCIKNNSLKNPKMNEKPIIYVRRDLMKSPESSYNKYPRSTNKSVILNKTVRLANENIDLPSSSKNVSNNENGLNVLSFKQEPLTDSFVECQAPDYLKYKHQSKHTNESLLYSPLNVPNLSTDLTLEHHSTVIAVQDKVGTSNCESASSNNNNATQWKSFWNKMKMDKQNRGKMGNKENVIESKNEDILMKKERYQTRAITQRENCVELSRKRKHDGKSVDENNKKQCNDTVKNVPSPLIHRALETVVAFSYLRNREMKEFVEKTGGSVTDDITQCTVLVSDKIRCTMKILSAIARGCPIVSANWVKHSYVVRVFEEMEEFITADKDAERKYNFQLKESLARARANKLLKGYTVLVTPSVKPGPKEMKVIITCAGGNYVVNWPKSMGQKDIIVTCNQDRNQWKPIWNNDNAKIIDSDTLITSIIRQKLIV